eukprot:2341096-Rhodomonas_salina.2
MQFPVSALQFVPGAWLFLFDSAPTETNAIKCNSPSVPYASYQERGYFYLIRHIIPLSQTQLPVSALQVVPGLCYFYARRK